MFADRLLSQTVKSARQRRQILRDRQKTHLLTKAIGDKPAKEVHSILRREGLSDSWLKKFFFDLEHALDDFRAGKVNRLQMQYLAKARPLIVRLVFGDSLPDTVGGQSAG